MKKNYAIFVIYVVLLGVVILLWFQNKSIARDYKSKEVGYKEKLDKAEDARHIVGAFLNWYRVSGGKSIESNALHDEINNLKLRLLNEAGLKIITEDSESAHSGN